MFKLDYVLLHFRSLFPGTENISLNYTGTYSTERGSINIRKYTGSFFEGKRPRPNQVVWKEWQGLRIPFFFEEDASQEVITYADGVATINYDIISSAFYLLSGWQEHYGVERDKFGRYTYKASVQAKYNIITKPVVNYYFEVLRKAIEQVHGKALNYRTWPDGSNFATCLTYDVDRLHSAWKVAGMPLLQSGDVKNFTVLQLKNMFSKDPWNNLPDSMALAERYGAKATFFMLASNQRYNGHPNADYDITKPKYQQLAQSIADRGHEVGIHGSFGTTNDLQQLKSDMRKLPFKPSGNRFHYLCHIPEKTPQLLQQSGLKYDSTLGFADRFGFRNSYCHPFYPYDFKNGKAHTYLELPLNLMDITLINPHYMHLKPSRALEEIEPMVQEIMRFNGLFTILWHNENISSYSEYPLPKGEPSWRKVLEDLLKNLQANGTAFLTCAEAAELADVNI